MTFPSGLLWLVVKGVIEMFNLYPELLSKNSVASHFLTLHIFTCLFNIHSFLFLVIYANIFSQSQIAFRTF